MKFDNTYYSGHMGTPLGSSYSATKFALHGYFDGLRAEISDTSVKVSIICPGPGIFTPHDSFLEICCTVFHIIVMI